MELGKPGWRRGAWPHTELTAGGLFLQPAIAERCRLLHTRGRQEAGFGDGFTS